jgi:O-antigen ligase
MKKKINPLTTSFLLACFFAPFYTLRLGNILFTVSDFFFVIGFILLILQRRITINKSFKKMFIVYFIGVMLILIGNYLSSIYGNPPTIDGITSSLQYAFVFILFPLVIISFDEDMVKKMLLYFLYGLTTVVFIGSVTHMFLPGLYKLLELNNVFIGVNRMGSFLGSNGLAKTIAITIPLLYLLTLEKIISKNKALIIFLIFLIGLLLASSFGGLLAAVISLLFILTLEIKQINQFKKLIFPVILLIIMVSTYLLNFGSSFSYFSTFENRVIEILATEDIDNAGSLNVKKDLMGIAWNSIKASPIIGSGFGNFQFNNIYGQKVHNVYLGLWVEAGLFGVIGLLIILFANLLIGLKTIFKYTLKTRSYGVVLFVFTLVLSINFITDTAAFVRSTILPLILLSSLVIQKVSKFNKHKNTKDFTV